MLGGFATDRATIVKEIFDVLALNLLELLLINDGDGTW